MMLSSPDMKPLTSRIAVLSLAPCLFACGEDPEPVASGGAPTLSAACVESSAALPADAWVCGEALALECGTPAPANLWVNAAAAGVPGLCSNGNPLEPSVPPVFEPGEYYLGIDELLASGGRNSVCTSTLTVVDTTPPLAVGSTVALWPPNHRFERVTVESCVAVTDACDPSVELELLWVEGNEAQEGPGNKSPEIDNLDCSGVDVRVERFGSGEGRSYRLGWRASDGSGNFVDGVCEVIVEHDQSGKRVPSPGVAWRVEVPADACGPTSTVDAGTPASPDAGSSAGADAGIADLGGSADTGSGPDLGSVPDAGTAPDLGSSPDAGTGSADAGVGSADASFDAGERRGF